MENFKIVFDVDDRLLNQLLELDRTVYNERDAGNFDLCKSLLTVNPSIYTVLMLDDKPIGYISFYPLKDEIYLKFRNGKLKDFELSCNDILNFNDLQSLNCLFSSIVIDKQFQKTNALKYLLSGFKRKIDSMNVKINKVLFDCVSVDGENLARNLFDAQFINSSVGENIFEGNMQSFMSNPIVSLTQKAGCYLVNLETKEVALIFREKQQDWSFPKGHLELNETLKECAIRETAEETKRVAKIVEDIEPIIETYTTPKGESCECFMFVAVDNGKSDNASTDTHDTFWIDIEEVENKLSYESLKSSWRKIKGKILDLVGNN